MRKHGQSSATSVVTSATASTTAKQVSHHLRRLRQVNIDLGNGLPTLRGQAEEAALNCKDRAACIRIYRNVRGMDCCISEMEST